MYLEASSSVKKTCSIIISQESCLGKSFDGKSFCKMFEAFQT